MGKIKLTKREYLGEGYWIVKETSPEPVSKEESLKGEYPSFSGLPLLNTTNGLPEINDYFTIDGKYFVYEETVSDAGWHGTNWVEYSEEEINQKYEI